eukprot:TRINITY_DN6317_c0_g1_i2.p1 TRINITY_DN6317_c0_g1~~TRINITY_DN6317_c0_g1_i2.p1  ORF type:complete len:250 (+),score=65.30 TRINITY_DN6317_c0_g1_i2:37-786(+)
MDFGWLAPEPLSDVFKAGGALEGLNEDLCQIVVGLVLLALLDVLVVRVAVIERSRYFALHAVVNVVVVVASAPDVWRGLTEPQLAWSGKSHTMVANNAIAAIHIYHCLAFKLTKSDIVHHAAFVSILCSLGILFKQQGGTANNFGCFFLSGLPGGLDYVLLILKNAEKISKMDEKYWNRHIQQWIRGPSMSIYMFIAFTSWYTGNTSHLSPALVILVTLLHFVNGIYYADEAVGSYYTWKERSKHHKHH